MLNIIIMPKVIPRSLQVIVDVRRFDAWSFLLIMYVFQYDDEQDKNNEPGHNTHNEPHLVTGGSRFRFSRSTSVTGHPIGVLTGSLILAALTRRTGLGYAIGTACLVYGTILIILTGDAVTLGYPAYGWYVGA